MSRTDKDCPHWVRAEFYVPSHMNCPNIPPHEGGLWRHRNRPEDYRCTLPDRVRRLAPTSRSWRLRLCTWEPDGWDRKYYTKPPRSYDRRIYFHGPNRREIRDFCAKALQEFRGSGDVEAIEPSGDRICQLDWWD